MQTRGLLRAQLTRAWIHTIDINYRGQLINSEHGLQLYFCAALLHEFHKSDVQRRLFIEPRLSFADGSSWRHPDIVICNTKSIIGIVELKYAPRGRPAYAKDIETLRLATENADTLQISNDRFRGITKDNRPYPLAQDAILCWAGVYSGSQIALRTLIKDKSLDRRFLQLGALTAKNSDAKVIWS
jgi:hypothetical protein